MLGSGGTLPISGVHEWGVFLPVVGVSGFLLSYGELLVGGR